MQTEFLAFPANIFRADAATTSLFVSEYLGGSGSWPLLVSGAAVVLASRVRSRASLRPRTSLAVVVPVVLLSTAALWRPAPHPLVYSVQDSVTGWLTGGER